MGRSLKYHIVEEADFLLIKVSGGTKKNEALLAKRMLSRYLKGKGIRVIFGFEGIGDGRTDHSPGGFKRYQNAGQPPKRRSQVMFPESGDTELF
jgi:hypothetical protein